MDSTLFVRAAGHGIENRTSLSSFNTRYFSNDPFTQEESWRCWPQAVVSRRKILSRTESEDVWFSFEKLVEDHIKEVLGKWDQIDDEIWAKVIYMERNRRIAKAYARAPVLTFNGSDETFDGYRIGVCGFSTSPDVQVEGVKRQIGNGVKIKMDDSGDIIAKRMSKADIFIREAVSEDLVNDQLRRRLELEIPTKLFHMRKFQDVVAYERRKLYPDWYSLARHCVSVISFGTECADLLDTPCWVLIINIVALDMLKSKIPLVPQNSEVQLPELELPSSTPNLGRRSTIKECRPDDNSKPMHRDFWSSDVIRAYHDSCPTYGRTQYGCNRHSIGGWE